jgi:error-prone DNA polymerase
MTSPLGDPFTHLHVASGYSLRYGASHPRVLVERAVDHGMDTLALTDRDGVYGAVKFAMACRAAGIRPVLGVDLAVEPSPDLTVSLAERGVRPLPDAARRTPARGGASVDPRFPRITLLAQDKRGWAALCRLVSATHLRGERGQPVSTLDLVAEHTRKGGLFVLLGPDSELGRAIRRRRLDLARDVLRRWRAAVATEDLLVEVISHRSRDTSPLAVTHAARMLRLADEEHLGVVLTNAVRYADRSDAPTADVLDASRRLVALDLRHVDRTNAEGFLKSGKEMAQIAGEVVRHSGLAESATAALLAATRRVADRCALDPRADLGIGEIHFPELSTSVINTSATNSSTANPSAANPSAGGGRPADVVLRERCEAGFGRRGMPASREVQDRLTSELEMIHRLGYPSYFLTVADVVDLIRRMGVRVAARGSGAGSLVTYLLGISGVEPMRYGLLMERFLSPLRAQLPDIDIDVESARRTEIYQRILDRFGGERCACVSMMDTYRVRHAIRDVGAALSLPPGEVDALAKSFPHIRARDARTAMRELPELRASGIGDGQLDLMFRLVERLDGLPRHVALHPCGVLLSDTTLLDRTPVEASWLGFPMSQFDKDDVEDLGLLKLDVLGVRMQSAMAHAAQEIARVEDVAPPDLDAVPLDDLATFRLIQSTRTLGCFQIESPGQRELIGKFAPETFDDLIIDISLFRPGPVKSDMVRPFLEARQGWNVASYLHPDLEPVLRETFGVVVFHEQVLRIVATFTGCTLAEADEARRAMGSHETQPEVQTWFRPLALGRGYDATVVDQVWEVLKAFASFGFCKAHAAAFALPTYQSAWLKAHHPAAFLAGVLTHDPGMYPKRLILDDARQFGIAVLSLDVNCSDVSYRVERVGPHDEPPPAILGQPAREAPPEGLPDGRPYGIRLALTDVKGITEAEVARIVAGRPYGSLSDFWHRAGVSQPVMERLVVAGAFDSLYSIGIPAPVRRRGRLTRRDLLLQVAELDRWTRAVNRGRGRSQPRTPGPDGPAPGPAPEGSAAPRATGVRELAARQSQGPSPVRAEPVQLTLDLLDSPEAVASGLPEMTGAERVRAELEVLGLDVSRHVVDFYAELLHALGTTRSDELLHRRSRSELLVAGVKVATQTPPIRSGRRVVFLTLDDATGPVDATFFEDAQGPYAATLFHSWLLVVRGILRRTGPRGVSLRATACWELTSLQAAWERGGLERVLAVMEEPTIVTEGSVRGAAASRSSRPVIAAPPVGGAVATYEPREGEAGSEAGGMGGRRVLIHASGFRQSPYADIKPAGEQTKTVVVSPPRKLWHSSPGSSGG